MNLKLIKRLQCAIFGHKFTIVRILNPVARKVCCQLCKRNYAIHYPTQTILPWDGDFEAAYAPDGPLRHLSIEGGHKS